MNMFDEARAMSGTLLLCKITQKELADTHTLRQFLLRDFAELYNFPYAFGGLFARGLYAQYRAEGEAFVPKYKKLLRSPQKEEPVFLRWVDFWGSCARCSINIPERQPHLVYPACRRKNLSSVHYIKLKNSPENYRNSVICIDLSPTRLYAPCTGC